MVHLFECEYHGVVRRRVDDGVDHRDPTLCFVMLLDTRHPIETLERCDRPLTHRLEPSGAQH
jgi:hypothetical protein